MSSDRQLSLGFDVPIDPIARAQRRTELLRYINLKLAANGLPIATGAPGAELVSLSTGLLASFREKTRLLSAQERCAADHRIESFLNSHFSDVLSKQPLRLPGRTFILDRHGLARELSLPASGDEFESELLKSYRVINGVLHNPRSDRRTTSGTFHIAAGGLPVPGDKLTVPRATFVELFRQALSPPNALLELPFTSRQDQRASTWVSLLLRPLVRPEVPGCFAQRTMEIRFFAPGSLVSNLDFVESIFGNAGDPIIPENDAALDIEHWSGHTGCVILAPHLTKLTKQQLLLSHISHATQQQIAEGMCWQQPDELYNNGEAFKVTCRTAEGVTVTIIADNYFGYCKKEVKTQISYATNLMGGAEEEHAGGALVFQSWSLGEEFQFNSQRYNKRTFDDVVRDYAEWIDVHPWGYGIDKRFPALVYVPENARADLRAQHITWLQGEERRSIPLLPRQVYIAPSGYRLRMEKHPAAPSWRLIGVSGEGLFVHKPCTVSGGGKSEISKSIADYMQYGSIFVADFDDDMQRVQEIFDRDYSDRWKPEFAVQKDYGKYPSRSILSSKRTLGSVIKLLTPSEEYTDEFNLWLLNIPDHIFALVLVIKRFQQPDWGDGGTRWQQHFSVDYVNGTPGHELKMHNRKLVGTYLRVGFGAQSAWRMFKVRQDFVAAYKVQTEDDITASTVVPGRQVTGVPEEQHVASCKFVQNCEYRLFQRPDDAIHRGLDKQAEADLARRDVNFISNFEPLTREHVENLLLKVVDFDAFTEPVKNLLLSVKEGGHGYIVCPDNPRRVGNVVTKNPRYLQDRPDLADPFDRYCAEMGTRLFQAIPADRPLHFPVAAILSGRRNNPPERDKGIRSLAVYNPIHYQELPELFMDYICSLTGKSPSTTGAGSEGALTKGPFNSLRPTADLNAALVSMILTGVPGFSTPAGHVGPNCRFDHDISYFVPEIWCRLTARERDPHRMIEQGFLEQVPDFKADDGKIVPARRLGYRITARFVNRYFGRVFDNPSRVFDEQILKPELQDRESFLDGVQYIMEAYERTARRYFEDGSIDDACPPLKALLGIMAKGSTPERYDETHPAVRRMFTREYLLESDWYWDRLRAQQAVEVALWSRHGHALQNYLSEQQGLDPELQSVLMKRQNIARGELERVSAASYLGTVLGSLGADPSLAPGQSVG